MLKLLTKRQRTIEVPAVQVQYHPFMDFFRFDLHVAMPFAGEPLMYDPHKKQYQSIRAPTIQFSFDPHFNRNPALELLHSSVYSGTGFGNGGYQSAKVTSYFQHGVVILADDKEKIYVSRDLREKTEQAVREIVDALAGNRLKPSGWRHSESVFRIDDCDKPLVINFMVKELESRLSM
ncbi:MAG: hypothetical protein AABX37_03340 [Nanoarchaeota archaeon]